MEKYDLFRDIAERTGGDIYIGVTFYSNSNGTMYRFDRNGNFVEKFDCGGQNPKTMVFID